MTLERACEILKLHNDWRRGDDSLEMPSPKDLGIAIDTVLNHLEPKKIDFNKFPAMPQLGFTVHFMPNKFITKGDAYLQIHPDDIPHEYQKLRQ